MFAEENNIEATRNSYDKAYCHQLELAYGDNFMSEGGGAESDRLLGDIDITNKKVLDFGCGLGGTVFHFAQKHGAIITGLDINKDMLATAASRTPSDVAGKVSFVLGDGSITLPFQDNVFEVIFSKGAILHLTIEQRKALFKEFYRVLKPGGKIAIFDPVCPQQEWGQEMQDLSDCEALPIFAQTFQSYIGMITDAGFKNITTTDESDVYASFNRDIVTRLESQPAGKQFAEQYGQALLDEHIKGYKGIANSLTSGEMSVFTFRAAKDDAK